MGFASIKVVLSVPLVAATLIVNIPAHAARASAPDIHDPVTDLQQSSNHGSEESTQQGLAPVVERTLLLLNSQIAGQPVSYTMPRLVTYSRQEVAALAGVSGFVIGLLALVLYAKERRLNRERLNHVAHAAVAAGTSERTRIARELHDGVCQLLAATKHSFEIACERCLAADDNYIQHLTRGLGQLEETIREIRRVTHNLKPALPNDLALPEALSRLSRDFSERTRIGVDLVGFDAGTRHKLPPQTELALYRIAQEALTNIEKHALASRCEMKLEDVNDQVALVIADNGRGLARAHRKRTRTVGIGLSNMRERLREVGGLFSIRSTTTGTEVVARVPAHAPAHTDRAA